jgi:glycosyltransferase involved in cell wall biosynthesis
VDSRPAATTGDPDDPPPEPVDSTVGESPVEISVVITSFGRRQYLLDALASVLRQSMARDRFEVLVAKNFADTDIDAELARCGARTVPVEGPNHGDWLVRAFELSRGELVVFLDDDDRMTFHRLTTVRTEFQTDPSLLYFHNGVRPIDRLGEPTPGLSAIPAAHTSFGRRRLGSGDVSSRDLTTLWNSGAAFNLSSIAVRRHLLAASRAALRRIRASSSAFLYYAALSTPGSLLIDPVILTEYRVHEGNLSAVVTSEGDLRWRRELRRARWVVEDCDVILEWLATRGASPELGRRLEVTRLRYGLLLASENSRTTRREMAARVARLAAASVPGYVGGSIAYLRFGVWATLSVPGVPSRSGSSGRLA